jgi:hypothetical protein
LHRKQASLARETSPAYGEGYRHAPKLYVTLHRHVSPLDRDERRLPRDQAVAHGQRDNLLADGVFLPFALA